MQSLFAGNQQDRPKGLAPDVASAASLHHFIANSPWSEVELRNTRLKKTLKALRGNTITLVIDETGDRKKGKKTDYVARQYLGSVLKDDAKLVRHEVSPLGL
jgi:SRSO17 transposase